MKNGFLQSLCKSHSLLSKFILPHLLVAAVIVLAQVVLFLAARSTEQRLRVIFHRVKQGNLLVGNITHLAGNKKRAILSYRFSHNDALKRTVQETNTRITTETANLRAITESPMGLQLLGEYTASRGAIEAEEAGFFWAMDTGSPSKIERAFNRWSLRNQNLEAALADLNVYQNKKLDSAGAELERETDHFKLVISMLVLFLVIYLYLSAAYIYRRVVKPILELTQFARSITLGELDRRVSPLHEPREIRVLGESLNQMTGNLQSSINALSRSNEQLEQFAYVASHDLREPLRLVSIYLTLVDHKYRDRLDNDGIQYIQYAVGAAKRMTEMVDALLAYARIGKESSDRAFVDTNQALDSALQNLELSIRESGAEVIRGPLPTIFASPVEILQVFQNLVGNALKFRGVEKPVVHVSSMERTGQWIFTVKDNGIGIPLESQKCIFAAFQRLHGKEEFPGTGLGLAVCKRVIEGLGGEVWVESSPGAGSSFFFSVPLRLGGALVPIPV